MKYRSKFLSLVLFVGLLSLFSIISVSGAVIRLENGLARIDYNAREGGSVVDIMKVEINVPSDYARHNRQRGDDYQELLYAVFDRFRRELPNVTVVNYRTGTFECKDGAFVVSSGGVPGGSDRNEGDARYEEVLMLAFGLRNFRYPQPRFGFYDADARNESVRPVDTVMYRERAVALVPCAPRVVDMRGITSPTYFSLEFILFYGGGGNLKEFYFPPAVLEGVGCMDRSSCERTEAILGKLDNPDALLRFRELVRLNQNGQGFGGCCNVM
jgi:hypothetical protein